MAKVRMNISIGEQTQKLLYAYSEKLDMSISAIITMLINNYDKEQNALNIMNNAELFNKIVEEINNGAQRDSENNL